ncbi:MAG: hypothetical protein SV775_15725 [Thermodesulfobacteriota bacterium]|nr:hypothetical protein [Thermodesulfobacteriota bacterium]
MAREDKGHYAMKHRAERKANEAIVGAVREKTSSGKISCAAAFGIAKNSGVPPEEVGFTIDHLEVTIVKCQLGLYGYSPKKCIIEPAETVTSEMEHAIRASMVNERIQCAAAWEVARKLNVGKIDVASACEALRIKISSCQLGAF